VTDPLRDEFERRSKSVNVNRDWARRELLPDVVAAIESRPQRLTTSRGPALAGLAGVAAIILVLVVAIPRLTPSPPAQSPVVPPPATGASISGPAPLQVMSAQEFAVGVLTGRLRSATVLVDGTIGSIGPDAPICPVGGPPCLMGRLEDADPSVDVHSSWLHAEEDPSMIFRRVEGKWPWWHLPSGPITGTLVLAVDGDGVIEFQGSVPPSNAAIPMTVAEATQPDVESVELDDVVLVSGWLWSGERLDGQTQLTVDICTAPVPAPIPGLPPNDYCALRDALVGYPSTTEVSLGASEPRLVVQPGAAQAYGGSIGTEPHIFALAPRLQGFDCESAPPCWKWEVVARLTAEQVTSEPSPPPLREFGCDLPPGWPVRVRSGVALVPSIIDRIGIVASCRVVETPLLEPVPNQISVDNPGGDQRVIELTWSGAPCGFAVRFTLSRESDGLHLDGKLPDFGLDCDDMGVVSRLEIVLTEPLDARSIAPTISDPLPPPTPTPDSGSRAMECSEPVARIGAVVIDETGLVASCVTWEPSGEGRSADGGPIVRNPDGDRLFLEIGWGSIPCDAAVAFRLAPTRDGYSLTMEPRPDGLYLGSELNGQRIYNLPAVSHAIRLQLWADIDVADVEMTLDRSPNQTPPPVDAQIIDCDGVGGIRLATSKYVVSKGDQNSTGARAARDQS